MWGRLLGTTSAERVVWAPAVRLRAQGAAEIQGAPRDKTGRIAPGLSQPTEALSLAGPRACSCTLPKMGAIGLTSATARYHALLGTLILCLSVTLLAIVDVRRGFLFRRVSQSHAVLCLSCVARADVGAWRARHDAVLPIPASPGAEGAGRPVRRQAAGCRDRRAACCGLVALAVPR